MSDGLTVRFKPLLTALGSIGLATHAPLRAWVAEWYTAEHFVVTREYFGHARE